MNTDAFPLENCLFHYVTVVLKVSKVAHVFVGQTEHKKASSSFLVSTGFQKP